MGNFFNCEIPVQDCRAGNAESSNNGAYVCRAEFYSPCAGTYLYRETWTYHGDLAPYPEWREITLAEYKKLYDAAVRDNSQLEEWDLRV